MLARVLSLLTCVAVVSAAETAEVDVDVNAITIYEPEFYFCDVVADDCPSGTVCALGTWGTGVCVPAVEMYQHSLHLWCTDLGHVLYCENHRPDVCTVDHAHTVAGPVHNDTAETGLTGLVEQKEPICIDTLATPSTTLESVDGCYDCGDCMWTCSGLGYAHFCCYGMSCCCYASAGWCNDVADCPLNMCS